MQSPYVGTIVHYFLPLDNQHTRPTNGQLTVKCWRSVVEVSVGRHVSVGHKVYFYQQDVHASLVGQTLIKYFVRKYQSWFKTSVVSIEVCLCTVFLQIHFTQK